MCHHREVIPVELKDLVIHQEPGFTRSAIGGDLCHVDSVVSITLRHNSWSVLKLIVEETFVVIVPEDFSCNLDLSRLQF